MDKLLLKEQEYQEMNKKLDIRTRELMEKINKLKDSEEEVDLPRVQSASEPQINTKLIHELPRSKSACNPSVAKFTPDELKALNLPEDINNVGAKGFVAFLKSKVKQLQSDFDKVSKDCREKSEELKKVQKEKVKLQEDKEKYLQQGNVARCQILKLETQLTMSQSKLQAKEGEKTAIAKEVDGLTRDLKTSKSAAQNSEVRCQRALEELAKLKLSLKSMQQNEKDLKTSHRKHSNTLTETIKRLEKQKIELLAGFKKQQALIENLKQQKTVIEASQFNEKIEADFIRMMTEEDDFL